MTTKEFIGSPKEIGSDLFIDMCMPAIKACSNLATPAQLAQMYGGFIGSCFGSMCADFGRENALGLFDHMVDLLQTIELKPGVH